MKTEEEASSRAIDEIADHVFTECIRKLREKEAAKLNPPKSILPSLLSAGVIAWVGYEIGKNSHTKPTGNYIYKNGKTWQIS